jgi:hypothetical protein
MEELPLGPNVGVVFGLRHSATRLPRQPLDASVMPHANPGWEATAERVR